MQGAERRAGQAPLGAGWGRAAASLHQPKRGAKRGAEKAASPQHRREGRKELHKRAGQEGTFTGCSEAPAEEGRGSTLANQPLLRRCSWCRDCTLGAGSPRDLRASFPPVSQARSPLRNKKLFLIQNVPQAAAELGFQPQNGCCENRYRVSLCASVPASAFLGSSGVLVAKSSCGSGYGHDPNPLLASSCFWDSRWFANEVICKAVTEGCCGSTGSW